MIDSRCSCDQIYRFTPFLETAEDMQSFCAREVEPMGKECEQLQIIALSEYLGIKGERTSCKQATIATCIDHTGDIMLVMTY